MYMYSTYIKAKYSAAKSPKNMPNSNPLSRLSAAAPCHRIDLIPRRLVQLQPLQALLPALHHRRVLIQHMPKLPTLLRYGRIPSK